MKNLLYRYTLVCTIFITQCFGIIVHYQAESIYYYDEERPPVIEIYTWSEKKHWVLTGVRFDSDGDWFLDSSMYLEDKQEGLTKNELAKQKARDEEEHAIRKNGAKIVPFFEELRKSFKLYPHKDLYKALEMDRSFRVDRDGYLRELSAPLPQAEENGRRRHAQAYQDLLKSLMEIKLEAPPKIIPKS